MSKNTILVVDDEPDLKHLILQKFRKKISTEEYEFLFANNGAEALHAIEENRSINLILADINMPVMDGLTLLAKMNQLEQRLLRAVIVSAYGDMENIRIAMNRGAYDFITKPIDLKDLEVTIQKSLNEIEIYKSALSSRDKLIAIKQELDIATAIQTSILPKRFPPFPDRSEFEIFAKMLTAREVGGDFFDFFLIDKYRLGISIGDVSGKGIAAAMLMAVSKTLLKATAFKGLPTDVILSEVNNILAEESPANMFVTIFYGVLDTRNGSFEYSNGGHNLPFLISSEAGIQQLKNIGGVILGVLPNTEYNSNIVLLKPGDTLLFYTDGITEAFNKKNEEYEEERLIASLQKRPSQDTMELVQSLISDVNEFSEGVEQSDDITCMALKYNGSK